MYCRTTYTAATLITISLHVALRSHLFRELDMVEMDESIGSAIGKWNVGRWIAILNWFLQSEEWIKVVSSTSGSGYFAPYYPITYHPCFQLQWYIVVGFADGIADGIAISLLPPVPCIYIEALVPYQIDRVLILDCQVRQVVYWP